ncbi:MAG: hypothetical protein BWY93_02006 [Euryarchaeota archaeon ADurb.BinA087]|nr:MAG: hypothetical protein BWY93_02006 [Euryarchaeota archaeon ADurb.BinA087]
MAFVIPDTLHEFADDLFRFSEMGNSTVHKKECPIGHLFDYLREMGSDHHAHVICARSLGKHGMDEVGCLWIERTGRLIGKEEEWLFGKLPCQDNPLLFTPGKIPGDVHHPMGESDFIEKICSTVDCLISGVIDVIESMQDVFDHAVVPIKSKRSLEHDGGTFHHPPFHGTVLLIPQIDIQRFHSATTFRAGRSCGAAHSHKVTGITGGDMIHDLPGSRGLLYPADQVHKHGLSCPTPSNNPEDFPFTNRKRNIIQDPFSIEVHADGINGDQWIHSSPLIT